jgi:propionyl-CoA carboxylase alpha chain
LNERKRGISGQLRGEGLVRFERERVVWLGSDQHAVTVEDAGPGVAIVFADGERWPVQSGWRPGEPVWRGIVAGQGIAVQVRPILNGVALGHAGAGPRPDLHAARGRARGADAGENPGQRGQAPAVPDAGADQGVYVTPGQEVKAGEPLPSSRP